MFYDYNGVKIHYQCFGEKGSEATLLLHGWGRSIDDFKTLASFFPNRFFIAIDFPPFGKSEKDIVGWSIFTYVQMVMSLCEHLKVKSAHVLGHSFGGRIAIILSAVECSFVRTCILIDSAGMKPKRNIKYRYKVFKYKLYKKFGKNISSFGSKDYLALSPELRKTFVNIVETHLEDYAKSISAKTLIIWGEKDEETPVYMANKLKRLIKNSQIKIIDNASHFSFLDCPLSCYRLIKNFWEED